MGKKLNNNELKAIGFYNQNVLEKAGRIAKGLIKEKKYSKSAILELYIKILKNPENYLNNELFKELANEIKELQPALEEQLLPVRHFELKPQPEPYQIFGSEYIEKEAVNQMNSAMKLPVSLAGALMPDAHSGYGLPIGGVLATRANTIIPYAVGVDIACRMSLSLWDIESGFLDQKHSILKKHLKDHTFFGLDGRPDNNLDESVFDMPEWNATAQIRHLKNKAIAQLGSSGTGNHFAEWGVIEILENETELKLPKGKYLAFLTHSGSRGFGAGIANHYSKLAMETTKLPREVQHLSWLDLDSEIGQEYWIGMNLAGEYASACHHQIHSKIAKSLEIKPIMTVENHHNFAWKEKLADGTEVIVHRKGATPAGKGILGIIPGSMAQSGFVVRGKGEKSALNSASHGAGRAMSRSKALSTITKADLRKVLADKGVTLIGSDIDEAPMAYKDIHQVMSAQMDLVDILAKFTPKIVRMADPDKRAKAWEK